MLLPCWELMSGVVAVVAGYKPGSHVARIRVRKHHFSRKGRSHPTRATASRLCLLFYPQQWHSNINERQYSRMRQPCGLGFVLRCVDATCRVSVFVHSRCVANSCVSLFGCAFMAKPRVGFCLKTPGGMARHRGTQPRSCPWEGGSINHRSHWHLACLASLCLTTALT